MTKRRETYPLLSGQRRAGGGVRRHPRRRSSILIQIGLLRRAYSALGLNPLVVMLALFGSLLGSYINLPARPPARATDRLARGGRVHGRAVPCAGRGRLAGHGARDQRRRSGHPDPAVVLSAGALSPLGAGPRRDRDRRLLRPSDGDPDTGRRHFGADRRAAAARRLRRPRSVEALRRPRSPISAAASASSSARICSISARCAASARRSPRSAARALSTAFS